ncbi:hemolysin III family protein [Caldibacillus lycopersici]|uniref:Hemolysin III family protein n=1 Tax=Perspicuibacillus lycopersici TaxID=1325689 RepID=A0AAE3IU46_9BACI|nr:hemolysin III family protein [Perspicuibacillus lycopersici]MCU9614452.1 hemolysin III family protein [Perspicuibacillus lycopersici]
MGNYIREPINSLTHLAGAVLAFFALLAMVIKAAEDAGSMLSLFAVIVFGISMILLYSASATYHMVIAKDKVIAFFRKIDHSMIFLLIAGTYTPFCLITLKGTLGWTLFAIISTIAIAGIVFKMVWFHCPRWISTVLYIAMGWIIVFVFPSLSEKLATGGITLLIIGGAMYTIGGIIYGAKPKFLQFKQMGFHEIFHVFILLGSLAHFLSVFLYVL